MPDRGRQVRLSEAAAAVDQERVVVRAGSLGDRLARAVGEAVRVSDGECREGEPGIEAPRRPELEAGDAPPRGVVHRCWQRKYRGITRPSYRVTRMASARQRDRFLDPPEGE